MENKLKKIIKEIRYHLLCYQDSTIDADDLAQAIEEIINDNHNNQ